MSLRGHKSHRAVGPEAYPAILPSASFGHVLLTIPVIKYQHGCADHRWRRVYEKSKCKSIHVRVLHSGHDPLVVL